MNQALWPQPKFLFVLETKLPFPKNSSMYDSENDESFMFKNNYLSTNAIS